MPVNLPSGLFARGYKIDTTPFTNVVLKDAAAKKAAKEAVVKNANDLYKGLNPAGVRPQDMNNPADPTKGINADINNWYNQAKAGNVDFPKYKELLYNIERSKQIGKEQLEIGGLVQQGKIEPDESHGDLTKLHAKDLSIYDAGHHDWKQGDLSPFVPELDESKWNNAIFGSAKPQERTEKKTFDAATGRFFIPKEYTPAEEKRFGDTAASLVSVDKSATKQFTKQTKNPGFLAEAIPVYKEVYGEDFTQKPEKFTADKAAAAAAILEARKRKDVVSYEKPAVKEDWRTKMDYAAKLKRQGSTDATGVVNKFIDDRFNEGKASNITHTITGYGGQKNSGYYVEFPIEVRNKYTVDKGFAGEKVPDSFMITTDKKKVLPIFYEKDEDGKNVMVDGKIKLNKNINAKPIDIDVFKVDLGQILVPKKIVGEEAISEEGYTPGTSGSSEYQTSGTRQSKSSKTVKVAGL